MQDDDKKVGNALVYAVNKKPHSKTWGKNLGVKGLENLQENLVNYGVSEVPAPNGGQIRGHFSEEREIWNLFQTLNSKEQTKLLRFLAASLLQGSERKEVAQM